MELIFLKRKKIIGFANSIKILFFLLGLFFQKYSYSQDFDLTDSTHTKKNALYLEVFGNAGNFSINYDRLFLRLNDGKINFSGRIGGGIQNVQHDSLTAYKIPIELNAFFGKRKKGHFESGIGYTPFIYKPLHNQELPPGFKNYYLLLTRLGYRFQDLNNLEGKRILPYFRVAAEGIFYQDYNKNNSWQFNPFISICLGINF